MLEQRSPNVRLHELRPERGLFVRSRRKGTSRVFMARAAADTIQENQIQIASAPPSLLLYEASSPARRRRTSRVLTVSCYEFMHF
jgi:hypothetical protein